VAYLLSCLPVRRPLTISSNSVELPGEVARLLSDLREENRALWREVKSLSSRIPQHGSSAANHGPAAISPNFGASSQGSQSQISSNTHVGLGGGHVLAHSRSSSDLGGGDGERDVDWEDDDGMNASLSLIGMGGSQGGEEWDPQSSRFNFWAGSGLNVPNLAFNTVEAPPGEEWKQWAEGEIIKERKRVEKLVDIVKALVDATGKGAVNGATASMTMDREPDGSKFRFCPCICILSRMSSPAEHPTRASRARTVF